MSLHDGLVLYHGNYIEGESPDLSKCRRFKDFGRGFYLTTSLKQAESFVRLSVRKAYDAGIPEAVMSRGYVSKYVFGESVSPTLCTLEFQDAVPEWLACIVAHRRHRSFPDIVQQYAGYDVIAGKIADDQTNITLALYMEGGYGQVGSSKAVRACIDQLMPEHLKDQFCFRTVKALSGLRYVGSENVWT